jgi:hypothetical protein
VFFESEASSVLVSEGQPQELGIEKRFRWHTFRHIDSGPLCSVGMEFSLNEGKEGTKGALVCALERKEKGT